MPAIIIATAQTLILLAVSFNSLLLALMVSVAGILAAVWWARRGRGGLDWVIAAIPVALGLSYLSSVLFRVPDYQSGCNGLCPGWSGYPVATHMGNSLGQMVFRPTGFLLNGAVYYAALLAGTAAVAWIASYLHWTERRWRWRIGFLFLTVLVPLALSSTVLPPPAPHLPFADQRLAINATRAWRWQLQALRLSDRRLAVEDVRLHPDAARHRVCFRVYTWFFLPYRHIYIDLEPAGVRATGGGAIPLSTSCWVQP